MTNMKIIITAEKLETVCDKLFKREPLTQTELWETSVFLTWAVKEAGVTPGHPVAIKLSAYFDSLEKVEDSNGRE